MKTYAHKWIAVILAGALTFAPLQTASAHDAYRITVSEQHGTTRARWTPPETKDNTSRTIILIEDAHDNFGAQENISQIISDLVSELTSDDTLVGIEGAVGDLTVAPLREYPLAEARHTAANTIMKHGYIAGAEHAAIAAATPLDLWGIEDQSLFKKDFKAFYHLQSRRESIEAYLDEIQEMLESLRVALDDEALNEIYEHEEAYHDGETTVDTYILTLLAMANTLGIDRLDYTQLMCFTEAIQSRSNINTATLLREANELAERVQHNTVSTEDSLTSDYIHTLLMKAQQESLDVQTGYPHIQARLTADRTWALIDFSQLMQEASHLCFAIKRATTTNTYAHAVIDHEEKLATFRTVLLLTGTRTDLAAVRTQKLADWFATLPTELAALSTRMGHPLPVPDTAFDSKSAVHLAHDFYALAEAREEAMLTNLLTRMDTEDKQYGIIVAGGYHTDGLMQHARTHNLPFVTVMPHVSNAHDTAGYMDRMMGQLITLPTHSTSYLRTSRINAVLETIFGDRGTQAIQESFDTAWHESITESKPLADKLLMIKENTSLAPAIREKATALYDVAHRIADTIDTTQSAEDIRAQTAALLNDAQWKKQVNTLLRSLTPKTRAKKPIQLSKRIGKKVTLTNGEIYNVGTNKAHGETIFSSTQDGVRDSLFLMQTDAPEKTIQIADGIMGMMYWTYSYYDKINKIAVYNNYKFQDDLDREKLEDGSISLFLRNIGYRGMAKLFGNTAAHTLNSPADGFPVTSVTTDYTWTWDAYFPGADASEPYGHHVFAIFPDEAISYRPAIRPAHSADPYFHGKTFEEFSTEDTIGYENALLIASESDYTYLMEQKPKSRAEALKLLHRSEEQQQEFEIRAYEESLAQLGEEITEENFPDEWANNTLYQQLLHFRAESPIEHGMLVHFRDPQAQQVLATGTMTHWQEQAAHGAIELKRINDTGDWAAVIPFSDTFQPDTQQNQFKFIVQSADNSTRWENGFYVVNHRDPDKNSILPSSRASIYAERDKARARLAQMEKRRARKSMVQQVAASNTAPALDPLIIADTEVTIHGLPIVLEDTVTLSNAETQALQTAIRTAQDRYFGLTASFEQENGTIHVTVQSGPDHIDDGTIRIPAHYIRAAAVDAQAMEVLVEQILVHEFCHESALFQGAVAQATASLQTADTALSTDTRARALETCVEEIFLNLRNKLVSQPMLDHAAVAKQAQQFGITYDHTAEPIAIAQTLFTLTLFELQRVATHEPSFLDRGILEHFIADTDAAWAAFTEPYAHLARILEDQSFGSEWIETADAAIDAVAGSQRRSRDARREALKTIKAAVNTTADDLVVNIFVHQELKESPQYQSLIKNIMTMTEELGVTINTEAAADMPGVLSLAFDGTADIAGDNVVFFSRDIDTFIAEATLFTTYFVQMVAQMLTQEHTSLDLSAFGLLNNQRGFQFNRKLVSAIDTNIVSTIRKRLFTQSA